MKVFNDLVPCLAQQNETPLKFNLSWISHLRIFFLAGIAGILAQILCSLMNYLLSDLGLM